MTTKAEKIAEILATIVEEVPYEKASGNATGSVYEFSDGSKLTIEAI